MRPIVMVVADVVSHEPFQVPLVQNDHVIQQVPSTASHRALRNTVLPRAAESGEHRQAAHLSRERHHVVAKLGVAVEQLRSRPGVLLVQVHCKLRRIHPQTILIAGLTSASAFEVAERA